MPHLTDVTTRITEALDKLAAEGSPAQVAVRLEIDGCYGERHSFEHCPVAEWLYIITGRHVSVGMDSWADTRNGSHAGWLPEPVAGFVNAFDAQRYPMLDLGAPR